METMVLQALASQELGSAVHAVEAEIAEPEGLPHLPDPGSAIEVGPETDSMPELHVATAETEPPHEAAAGAGETETEAEIQAEPVVDAELEPQQVDEPEPDPVIA